MKFNFFGGKIWEWTFLNINLKASCFNTEEIQFTDLLWPSVLLRLHYVTGSAPVIQLHRVPLIIKPN